ncbi:MAG TPA: heme ABC exporter ATP-binding protein CcmA [Gemmatimonadales bacterium]|nr:heme ABC exporter ATP-binding protein CcmA [Gemmatimonadales bacterium]
MPSSDGPLLEGVGLYRSFGRARVLRGLDLSLGPGEALAVVGPNGAGKTTLLRLLAGLMRPTRGEVRALGRRVEPSAPESRRALGFLSHQSLLYDDLSILESLTFAARLYGLDAPVRAARAALESVGLADRAADRPPSLSRGMLQRAAIARALLHGPRVLLLDEPFTALDAGAAERLRAMLHARLAEGLAIVLVTHDLPEAWALASRVAVLAGGRWALETPRRGELAEFLPRYHELAHA